MSSNVSYFVCGACGATDRSTEVGYDSLGYPVCPTCGRSDAPTVPRSVAADEWLWAGDDASPTLE